MKKKTVVIAGLSVLAAGLLAVGLAGCGSYKFEKYSFNYGGESENDWRALEYPDKDIDMDGLVDTAEYGEQYLSFSDVNGVNMKVYAHMGEEGVFFGFVSNDKNVNYNSRNAVYNNTSVEIQVAPKGTETLNSNVVQLRLGADGTPDQWVGFPSEDGYSYSNKYIPSMGVVHINGTLNGSADGYSVELYLPYTSIGLTAKPKSIVCAPSFNTLSNPTNTQRATWTLMLGCRLDQPATWYVVDETGMTARTAGFEKSNTTISQDGGYNQFYYFDTAPSESYYLKTTVQVQASSGFLNDDNFPKFGLVNKSENALQAFYIDAAGRNGTNFGTVKAVQTTLNQTDWQWDNNASTSIAGHWGNEYIEGSGGSFLYRNRELETIYYEGDLYFILNGVLVKTVKNFAPTSEGAVPGLMCFNTKATYTVKADDYSTDSQKVKAEVEKYLAKDRKIDGDLSDWTDEAINRHAKEVVDSSNGNSMKVRAFRGTDGLYIAYEVAHRVNLAPSKWDDGWWNNTNIELYVNGVEEKNHYALTTFGDGGYMDGVMLTTRNADRTYNTVAEIFIPFASLEKDGFDTNSTLKVGFAFKSADGSADDKLNGNDWWAIEGTPKANQLSVQGKGIGEEYTLTYIKGGDDVEGEVPPEEVVFEGDIVILPVNPFTKTGHTFVGWTDGTNAYAQGEEFVMPGHAVTLYPRWIEGEAAGEYRVTYQKGEGEVSGNVPVDDTTYAPGQLITVKSANLTRDGYRFAGWSDGHGNTYASGSKIFMGNEDITLTAVWEQVYKLTYEKGTGNNIQGSVPDEEEHAEGDVVVIRSADLSRNGYEFFGWSCSYGDAEKVYTAGDDFTMPAQNVTFTAIWKVQISVDGSLSDWNSLGSKTIEAHSVTGGGQSATWYGVLRDEGLYLAVDITHKEIGYGQGNWYDNLNFEIHLGSANQQHYVYLATYSNGIGGLGSSGTVGTSSPNMTAAFGHSGGTLTSHRSIIEVFFPSSMIAGWLETDGSIRIGVAIKTNGNSESISGGTYNYASGDPWYMPYGVDASNYDNFAYVTRDGMYLKHEYEHSDWKFGKDSLTNDTITVDGNLNDWNGSHTIGITGSDMYEGKSVTFYGKMTTNGLYLAVDAYHGSYTYGENDWWNNTNFELRIGEVFTNVDEGHKFAKQFWVYATGEAGTDAFKGNETYMTVKSKTETVSNGTANYHTVIEVLIPYSNLVQYDYMVQNGMIHVGVAWKTNGDSINNGAINGGTDPWWVPKDTHINTNPACVDGSGIYTAKEYEARQV